MDVYVINPEARTTCPMEVYTCTDESKDLQDLLAKNPGLLPGDQIDPESPCRWMLVKREMPVPDPSTGANRWSLDFLFVDQKAMPTFVECKLFKSTEARRQVVGQALEYAANGHYYWSGKDLLRYAEASAKGNGSSLIDAFESLHVEDADSVESFFDNVEKHLKDGEVRIVFFLERAPNELKSLVDFLNKQMSRSEVLLVEARQYSSNELRVVVPMLFGFTEQIRETKRLLSAAQNRTPVAVDWDGFRANAQKKGLDERAIGGIRRLYETCELERGEISWGRGVETASFSAKWPDICTNASVFSVYATGDLELHFGSYRTSETARAFPQRLRDLITNQVGLSLPDDYLEKWPRFPLAVWLPKLELFVSALHILIAEFVQAKTI